MSSSISGERNGKVLQAFARDRPAPADTRRQAPAPPMPSAFICCELAEYLGLDHRGAKPPPAHHGLGGVGRIEELPAQRSTEAAAGVCAAMVGASEMQRAAARMRHMREFWFISSPSALTSRVLRFSNRTPGLTSERAVRDIMIGSDLHCNPFASIPDTGFARDKAAPAIGPPHNIHGYNQVVCNSRLRSLPKGRV